MKIQVAWLSTDSNSRLTFANESHRPKTIRGFSWFPNPRSRLFVGSNAKTCPRCCSGEFGSAAPPCDKHPVWQVGNFKLLCTWFLGVVGLQTSKNVTVDPMHSSANVLHAFSCNMHVWQTHYSMFCWRFGEITCPAICMHRHLLIASFLEPQAHRFVLLSPCLSL